MILSKTFDLPRGYKEATQFYEEKLLGSYNPKWGAFKTNAKEVVTVTYDEVKTAAGQFRALEHIRNKNKIMP